MAIYSACVPIYQVANGTPAADFMTGPSNAPVFIELGAQVGAASATIFGIGRAATAGQQVGGLNLIAEDANNSLPCQTTVATQWTVAPTIPSVFLRRIQISGASIGQGMIITFPRGLSISEGGSSLVFWNLTATQAAGSVIWGQTDE